MANLKIGEYSVEINVKYGQSDATNYFLNRLVSIFFDAAKYNKNEPLLQGISEKYDGMSIDIYRYLNNIGYYDRMFNEDDD